MKRIKLLLCFLLLILCLQPAYSQAPLVLSTVNGFPPYSYLKDGKLTGIDIEIIKEMAQRLNLDIKLVTATWKGVMHQVEAGMVDGGFAAFLTPERQNFSLYTAPLHYEEFHLFVNAENKILFEQFDDLNGKTIGKESGAFISDEFQRAVDRKIFTLHEGKNDSNLKMLAVKRLDGVVGHLDMMKYQIQNLKLKQNIAPVAAISPPKAAYLILSKKSKYPGLLQLQKSIKKQLLIMQKDGTYERISNRYLMAYLTINLDPF